MDSPAPLSPTTRPKITLDRLDGSHMGLAVALWRARADNDDDFRRVVADLIPASESLRGSLDLFLSLAHAVAEANGEHDGGARLIRVVADRATTPAMTQFCHEVADTLAADPEPVALTITAVPVFGVIDLCAALGRLLALRTGKSPRSQIDAWTERVYRAALDTV